MNYVIYKNLSSISANIGRCGLIWRQREQAETCKTSPFLAKISPLTWLFGRLFNGNVKRAQNGLFWAVNVMYIIYTCMDMKLKKKIKQILNSDYFLEFVAKSTITAVIGLLMILIFN